jgi:hypothetical protein
MENQNKYKDKFNHVLKSLTTELEEWQVQAALGKAEAKEKWEEYEKKLKQSIHEAKHDFNHGTGTIGEIRNKMEELEVQLSLGKAEATEYLEEKSKTLKLALHELKHLISGLKE